MQYLGGKLRIATTLLGCPKLFRPPFCAERELIKFSAGLTPTRIVLIKDGGEAITMCRFNQVSHLVHNHVFKEVSRLLHQFRVQPDMPSPMIAASPFGFHALEEIAADLGLELLLPFFDQWRYCLMQE